MPAKKQISASQERLLLQVMQENPEIANNRVTSLTDSMAKQNLQKFWESLASRLNAMGSGNTRVWQKWRDYWTERKYGVRRKVSKIQAQTGSGSYIKLTDVEELILEIMDMKPTCLGSREPSASQGYYDQEYVLECAPAAVNMRPSPAHSPLMESALNTLHKSEIKSDPLQEPESPSSSHSANSQQIRDEHTHAPSWAIELENRRLEMESQQLRVLERLATSVDKLASTADKLLQILANK